MKYLVHAELLLAYFIFPDFHIIFHSIYNVSRFFKYAVVYNICIQTKDY